MKIWYEFHLIFSEGKPRDFPKENYQFTRTNLLPLIEKLSIGNFSIANIWEENKRDYIRFRVNVDDVAAKELEACFAKWKDNLIRDYEQKIWDPRDEVLRALVQYKNSLDEKFGWELEPKGWKVVLTNGVLAPERNDHEKMVRSHVGIETDVLGKALRIFMEEFEAQPDDLYLVSELVHQLLNSIGYTKLQEFWIRLLWLPFGITLPKIELPLLSAVMLGKSEKVQREVR